MIRSRLPTLAWRGRSAQDLPTQTTSRRAGTVRQRYCFEAQRTTPPSMFLLLAASWRSCLPFGHCSLAAAKLIKYTKYAPCSGPPATRRGRKAFKLAAQMNFRFPQFVPTPLNSLIPNATQRAFSLSVTCYNLTQTKGPPQASVRIFASPSTFHNTLPYSC